MSVQIVPVTGYGDRGYGEGGYGDSGYYQEAVVDPIDHVALGLSRVLQQYQNSPKLLGYLSAMLSMSNELEAAMLACLSLPNIDVMTGVNLDTIGIIVGRTRQVPNVVTLSFFGFAGEPYETVFGELSDASIGSRFYELGEPFSSTDILPDSEYRLLLRSQIIRNNTSGTCEDILSALATLFQTNLINITDGGCLFNITIGRTLAANEVAMLTSVDILPRPAGIGIGTITTPSQTITINSPEETL